jgi:dTMP kinase
MFITFEGPEGAGKSTLIQALSGRLQQSGQAVLVTREPGAGPVGSKIRAILLDGDEVHPRAEMFLFLADRAQHIEMVVRPALARGEVVLCDRHADSTVVYQGYARGGDIETLRAWNAVATGGLVPELTLLVDIDPAVGLARQERADRLGSLPLEFHQRVREGFLAEARLAPNRFFVLDGSASAEDVAEAAWSQIQSRLRV